MKPIRAIRFREATTLTIVPPLWTLDEALAIIHTLQPESRRFNYHVCLGGGVLNDGGSDKDLDLYFLPLNNGIGVRQRTIVDWLDSLWGKGQYLAVTQGYWSTRGIEARIYTYSGRRVDVFIYGDM